MGKTKVSFFFITVLTTGIIISIVVLTTRITSQKTTLISKPEAASICNPDKLMLCDEKEGEYDNEWNFSPESCSKLSSTYNPDINPGVYTCWHPDRPNDGCGGQFWCCPYPKVWTNVKSRCCSPNTVYCLPDKPGNYHRNGCDGYQSACCNLNQGYHLVRYEDGPDKDKKNEYWGCRAW